MNKEILEKVMSKRTIVMLNIVYFIFTLLPICVKASISGYGDAYYRYNAFQMGLVGIVWIILPAMILLLITLFEKQATILTDMAYLVVAILGLLGVYGAPRKFASPLSWGSKWCLVLYAIYIILIVTRLVKARMKNEQGE